jgi:amino acid transporter
MGTLRNDLGNYRVEEPIVGTGDKGLKQDALSFFDVLIFGVAAVAPVYSIVAVIGLITVAVGVQAPAVLLTSFVPMFLVAAGFYYMNRADPDCGATFSWATRALGPWSGWIGGWTILASSIIVTGALVDVSARYTYVLLGLEVGSEAAAASKLAVTALAVAFIAALTIICVLGIEVSARVQNVMTVAQVGVVLLFAVVALARVFGGAAPEASVHPKLSWFSPLAVGDSTALLAGLLVGVFIYWGWETSVIVAEVAQNSARAPGLAAVLSTVILLVTYVSVSTAVVAFAGPAALRGFADDDTVLSTLAIQVLGAPWDKLVDLAVLSSGLACTQALIIYIARMVLSMVHTGALPESLGRVHPRFRTPHVSTIALGVAAIAWYVPLNFFSQNFLYDSLSALSLMVAFYYALTGISCVIYYRRELLKSAKTFVFIGVAPLLGATMLGNLFVTAIPGLADPGASYSGGSAFGVGLPLVTAVAAFAVGAMLVVIWRLLGNERFFGRRAFEAVDEDPTPRLKSNMEES